jgi:transposase
MERIMTFDLNKETSIGLLKEVIRHLEEKIFKLEKKVTGLDEKIQSQEEKRKLLLEELTLLKKRYFDNLSEKGKKRSKYKKRKETLIYNQNPLGDLEIEFKEIEEISIIHELIEKICKECGSNKLKKMNGAYEMSKEVEIVEQKFIVKSHLREKWQCLDCGKISTARGSLKLVSGGKYSINLGIEVVIDKYLNHIPLDRQRRMMARDYLIIDTKTLYGLTRHLEMLLEDIPKMILKEILKQKTVCVDESPLCIFSPERKKGYVWSVSNNYGQYYQYELTRSGKVAEEMLLGFKGRVMSDAYGGYNFLYFMDDIVHAGCWSHSRRKFIEAENDHPISREMVELINKLYDIDHEAISFEHLLTLRKTKSVKVLERIEAWMENAKGKYLKDSKLGKAIKYLKRGLRPFESKGEVVNPNHIGALREFIRDAYIPLDNNIAEQSQRAPVMGRKNFNGFKTLDGADTGMVFYSIVGSCHKLKVPVKSYLKEMTLRALKNEKLITPFEFGRELQKLLSQKSVS